jgi:OOP family OmpA-OmpF porin
MRRIILSLPISLMAIWGSQAMAVDFSDGFRIGASGGLADNADFCLQTGGHTSCDAKDFAWKIYGGYQFMKWIAVEGGYVDLGKAETLGPGGGLGDSSTAASQALVATGVFTAPGLEAAGFYIKLGGAWWDQDRQVNTFGFPTVASSETGVSPLAGAGFRFPFKETLGLVFEYEHYFDVGTTETGQSDIGVWSVGLLWSF